MIDHLLVFADEAAAAAALPEYCIDGVWRGDCCIAGVRVYQVTGTDTATDPTTGDVYEREIQVPYDGWFVLIARPELDPALREPAESILIRDRVTGEVLFVAPDIEPPLDTATITPQFA